MCFKIWFVTYLKFWTITCLKFWRVTCLKFWTATYLKLSTVICLKLCTIKCLQFSTVTCLNVALLLCTVTLIHILIYSACILNKGKTIRSFKYLVRRVIRRQSFCMFSCAKAQKVKEQDGYLALCIRSLYASHCRNTFIFEYLIHVTLRYRIT